MGKYGSNKFSVLLVDGFNLLASKLKDFSYKNASAMERIDGLGDDTTAKGPTGVSEVALSQGGAFFDDSAGNSHLALKASTAVSRVLCFAFQGNVIGQPFMGVKGAYSQSYEVLAKGATLTKANATYDVSPQSPTDLVDEGVILQSHATKTADWNTKTLGTPVDSGASSSNGGAGYLQVSALSGFTSFVGKIRHSSDDITYVDLITFTAVTTAPAAEAKTVGGTVNRHLCFDGDVTGAGSITVFAGVARR